MKPFLQNHQYNYIARQARHIISTLRTCPDPKVIDMVRYTAVNKVVEACPNFNEEELFLVKQLSELQTGEELQVYLKHLFTCIIPFPELTELQIKRLFPKVKKLFIPDLMSVPWHALTYLCWVDPGTNKKYLVYYPQVQQQQGVVTISKLVGLEGEESLSKVGAGFCAFCKRAEETSLFAVAAKTKTPDQYRTVAQHICVDSAVCNSQITDVIALEEFLDTIKMSRSRPA